MILLEPVQHMVLLSLNIHYFERYLILILIMSFYAGASGIWGIIAIGLFADNPYPLDTTSGRKGLFKGL